MPLTRRGLVALALVAALAAVTIWGPNLAITIAWVLAALAVVGWGLGRSPRSSCAAG
jgi:hypothetical protein